MMIILVGGAFPSDSSASFPLGGGPLALSLPETGWRVEGAGEVIESSPTRLIVNYHSPDHEPIFLYLPTVIELPEEGTRLRAWFASVEGDCSVSFIVRDRSGAVHRLGGSDSRLNPPSIWHDRNKARTWPLWTQTESINMRPPIEEEIRSRLLPEDADAAMAHIWPHPLEWIGIEILPSTSRWGPATSSDLQKMISRGKGTVVLRDFAIYLRHGYESSFYSVLLERMRSARNEAEALFPDELTVLSGGDFGYQIELFRGYNGPLVWATRGHLRMDRSNTDELFENRVRLPRVERGEYIIRITNYRENGTRVGSEELTWLVGEGEDAIHGGVLPAMRWETGKERHVFPSDSTSARLHLHLDPETVTRLQSVAECRFSVACPERKTHQEEVRPLAGEMVFEFAGEAGQDYYATAQIVRGERILEEQILHFGFATPPVEAPSVLPDLPPGLPDRDEFLNGRAHLHPQYRMAAGRTVTPEFPHFVNIEYQDVSRWADLVADLGAESVSFKAGWVDIEPLPGVWRWDVLDECLRILGSKGRKVILSKSPIGRTRIPRWIGSLPMRDQFGEFRTERLEVYPLDPEFNDGWVRFWTQAARRYRQNPTVIGFRIDASLFFGTWNPESIVMDYSHQAQEGFNAWRRGRGEEEIPLPRLLTIPGIRVDKLGPDMSDAWRAFVDFRSESIHEALRRQMAALRSVDSRRIIMVERRSLPSAIEGIIPDMVRYEAAFKNEGSPSFREASLRSMSVQAGIPYAEELHRHIPSSRSISDAVNFWSSYLGNGAFWLNTWNPSFLDNPQAGSFARDFPEVFEFIKQTQPVWEEYVKARFFEPEILIYGSRLDRLISGNRRGHFDEIAGQETHSALFQHHQVPVHFANEHADWVDLDPFKLVLVCGEVLPQKAVDRITAYARGGGKLVLVGDAGRYIPDAPRPRATLREALNGVAEVRTLSEPKVLLEAGMNSWDAPKVHHEQEVEELLDWAGVQRPAEVEADGSPGFQVQVRSLHEGRTRYVAVMRNWHGFYRDNIELQDVLEQKYGVLAGVVTVRGLEEGEWRVEKIHRQPSEVGQFRVGSGEISFSLAPAVAGEVQIFRITKL